MKTTRSRTPSHAASPWRAGVIGGVNGADFTVAHGGLQTPARRAASCLLEPAPGDSVACLQLPGQPLWIMAVLTRSQAAGTPHRLLLPGDASIEAEGALQLKAGRMKLQSREFQLHADQAEMVVASGELVGRHLRITGAVLKLVASMLSTAADRVSHFSRHHVRTTEGIDRVSATHVECEAQQLLRLSGEHALVNGEKLVKTRGGQIHFG